MEIKQVVFNMNTVRQHIGLALQLQSSQLASTMGPAIEAQEMSTWRGFVCMECQGAVMDLMGRFETTEEGEPDGQ